jgi:hypothetical protein
MIDCRPVHHATSGIRRTVSPAPLDEKAQLVFEQFDTGYLVVPLGSCTWEKGERFVSLTFYFSSFEFIPGFAYID